jgi:hypothetical protein
MCNIWWPTFGNAERSLALSLSAQCLNTESVVKDVICKGLVGSREGERETKRLLSALPNVGHQILHISGAGIISSSPYIPH